MAGLRVWCEKELYQTPNFKQDLTRFGFSLLDSDKSDGADVVILIPPGSNAEELTAMGRIVIEVSQESKEDCDEFNTKHKMTGHRKISQSVVNESEMLMFVLLHAVVDYDNVHTLRNTMVELYGVLQRAQVTSVNRLMAKLGVPAPSALVVGSGNDETHIDTQVLKDGAERVFPMPDGASTSLDASLRVLYIRRGVADVYLDPKVLAQSLSLPVILAVTREDPTNDVQRMEQVRGYQEDNPIAMLALVMYTRMPGVPVTREQHLAIVADGVDQLNMRAHTSLMSQLPPRANWFLSMKTLFANLNVSSQEFYDVIMRDPIADSTPVR